MIGTYEYFMLAVVLFMAVSVLSLTIYIILKKQPKNKTNRNNTVYAYDCPGCFTFEFSTHKKSHCDVCGTIMLDRLLK